MRASTPPSVAAFCTRPSRITPMPTPTAGGHPASPAGAPAGRAAAGTLTRRRARPVVLTPPLVVLGLVVMVAFVAVVVAAGAVAGSTAGAVSAVTPVPDYAPPIDAPVSDPFRPPATRFGPGNRGLQYGAPAGTLVRASAAGRVAFAGRIGGAAYVTVAHADGVRTTYSYLAAATVRAGQPVAAGQPLGRAGPGFHFGARIGRAYVDPAVLLAGGQPGPARVFLIPARAAGAASPWRPWAAPLE